MCLMFVSYFFDLVMKQGGETQWISTDVTMVTTVTVITMLPIVTYTH